MKIELRRIAYSQTLSEETGAFTGEVGNLLTGAVELRRLKRQLRTNLVMIERGQDFLCPLCKRPLAIVMRAVIVTNPAAMVVNGANDDVLRQAVDILVAAH